MELYSFQQQLAKIQVSLEKTHENYNAINRVRLLAEEQLELMRQKAIEEETITQEERLKVSIVFEP